jgi:hypothetical protein
MIGNGKKFRKVSGRVARGCAFVFDRKTVSLKRFCEMLAGTAGDGRASQSVSDLDQKLLLKS